jgi:5-methylcytosine-specific restriction protein A
MPSKPLKPCRHPGCPELTSGRYCPAHEKKVNDEYEQRRGTAVERGYNWNWHKIRNIKLAAFPLCERCEKTGRIVVAVLVHHKDRNPRNNDPVNLESLCEKCHQEEHKEDRWVGGATSYPGQGK